MTAGLSRVPCWAGEEVNSNYKDLLGSKAGWERVLDCPLKQGRVYVWVVPGSVRPGAMIMGKYRSPGFWEAFVLSRQETQKTDLQVQAQIIIIVINTISNTPDRSPNVLASLKVLHTH